MKKFLLILTIFFSINIASYSYTVDIDGMDEISQWFENCDYWNNKYYTDAWSVQYYNFAGMLTNDYSSYLAVVAILGNSSIQNLFTELDAAKTAGTLTEEMVSNFFDTVYSAVLDGMITAWEFNGSENYGDNPLAPGMYHKNITVGGLSRGIGILTSGTAEDNAWGGTDMIGNNINQAKDLYQDYITFTIKPNAGYIVSLDSICAYNIRKNTNGATSGLWQYSIDDETYVNIGSTITWGTNTTDAGNDQAAIALSSIANLQNVEANTTITFRLLLWGASSTDGSWYFNDNSSGFDLKIKGEVEENPNPYLDINTSRLNGFIYSESELGPSEAQSFTLIGGHLTSTDVIISAPTNYEISTSESSGFSSSLTITPVDSAVNQTIYVRLKGYLSIGTYYQSIAISGGGTSSTTSILVDGVVVDCMYIWLEDFDSYSDGTQSSTKFYSNYTEPESGETLQKIGKSYWGVDTKKIPNK